ncbi:MAG TPA: heparinase II/III family protein [Saprospiraceae bacterium]|nr:heparinase II/III family protein [Saprospiraceae bacterium]HNT22152.1 heparinase II/III family protein [Saprospiraceae bacterium]
MKAFLNFAVAFSLAADLFAGPLGPFQDTTRPAHQLENPMSVQYMKEKLRRNSPRLVLTPELEQELRLKIISDPVIKNVYQAIRLNTQAILREPLLERVVVGRRLLATSREMLYRMNMLGMAYRMEKDPILLDRINEEVLAVCDFSDWNQSHYLDVAEMALAVAFALDWAGDQLPVSTVQAARRALIEKGLKPSYDEKGNTGWIRGTNNWNQVCHGGMIAAAIVIAEEDPALASETIRRALEGIPYALDEYGPDGVYPEGATYWGYGTSFSVVTAAILESAFGTDFGLSKYPAFIEGAACQVLNTAPSGWYYNFADCGDRRNENGDMTLAWFAAKTGNKTFYEKERFLMPPDKMGKLGRLDGAGLVWLAKFRDKPSAEIPQAWKGAGSNPIVIFKSGPEDPHQYYFGGKGGRGLVNHGNMDGGSFVFEVNGIRWVVDPGNQDYHLLEKTGFDLWGRCQNCQRWTLLTKNNFGHSTLTVNDGLHAVDGMATITGFRQGPKPEAVIDLTPAFSGQLQSAQRRFVKDGPQSLLVEDLLETTKETRMITWQLMTTADIEIINGGAVLHKEGKQLRVENLSHPGLTFSVISLYPAPLELDRQIPGLKRLELRIPAYLLRNEKEKIAIKLSGQLP